MPDETHKPDEAEDWHRPSLGDMVQEAFSMAKGSRRANQGVTFLQRIMEGGELPQPYADLLDPKFWDSLPTREDLRRHGLGRGFGIFDDNGGKDWRLDLDARMDLNMNLFALRDVFINRFAFAIPSREAIECIAGHSRKIVEINAGTGFWARLLAKRDVDVVATDLKTEELHQNGVNFEVLAMDGVEAVKTYPDRDVFTCWPHMHHAWLTTALSHMQPDRLLFFIGEGGGGCTGHSSTHRVLADPEIFEEIDYHSLVQFSGIHDDLYIYRRTSAPWKHEHNSKVRISTKRWRRRDRTQKSSGSSAALPSPGSSASGAEPTSDT